jgi:hypothetical protein
MRHVHAVVHEAVAMAQTPVPLQVHGICDADIYEQELQQL